MKSVDPDSPRRSTRIGSLLSTVALVANLTMAVVSTTYAAIPRPFAGTDRLSAQVQLSPMVSRLRLIGVEEPCRPTSLAVPNFPTARQAPFLDVDLIFREAEISGHSPMLMLYRGGCSGLRRAAELLMALPHLHRELADHFYLIAVNADSDGRPFVVGSISVSPTALADTLGVAEFPAFAQFDADGRFVQRIESPRSAEELLHVMWSAAGLDVERTGRSLPITYAKSDRASLSMQGRTKRDAPIAVIVGGPSCNQCEEFQRWILQQRAVSTLLDHFAVVRIDVGSTVRELLPNERRLAERARISMVELRDPPTVLLFAPGGREVARFGAFDEPWVAEAMLEYVLSESYRDQPSIVHYLEHYVEHLEVHGRSVD